MYKRQTEPTVVESLAELNYGAWEGRILGEVMESEHGAFAAWDADPATLAPPGGETGIEALGRVVPLLDPMAVLHRGKNVAIVCHKTICRLVVCRILGIPLAEYRRRLVLDNAALTIIERWEQGWRLVLFNDTSHLSGTNAEGEFARDF